MARPRRGRRTAAIVAGPVLALAVLGGAAAVNGRPETDVGPAADAGPDPASPSGELTRARDCEDLTARMRERALASTDELAAADHDPGTSWRGPLPADPSAPLASQAGGATTDGRLIVTLLDEGIGVIDVSGGKPRPRGSVHLNEVMFQREVLVQGTRALVVGQTGDLNRATATALAVVDFTNPDRLRVVARERVEGVYLAVRVAAGRARVVLRSGPDLPLVTAEPGRPESARRAAEVNREVARAAPAAAWLPRRAALDRHGLQAGPATPLVACQDVHLSGDGGGLDMLTLLSVDLSAEHPLADAAGIAVVGAGERAYVSSDRLYTAVPDGSSDTAVHAFALSPGGASHLASGVVRGRLPSPSALSASGGLARLVLTDGQRSDLVVLTERGRRLVEVGRADEVARRAVGSVTWSANRAVILSARQADPVGLVDLSDPARPAVLPELPPARGAVLLPQPDGVLLSLSAGPVAAVWKPRLVVTSYDTGAGRIADLLRFRPESRSYATDDPRSPVYLPDRRTVILSVDHPARSRCHRRTCTRAEGAGAVFGLVALRVDGSGRLSQTAHWAGRVWRPDPVLNQVERILVLPGGRLAVLDGYGCTILDARTFRELGHGRLPNP